MGATRRTRALLALLSTATATAAPAADDATDARLDALERAVEEIRTLLRQQAAHHAPPSPSSPTPQPQTEPVAAVDQRLRVLERQVELERERNAEAAKKQHRVVAGSRGIEVESPDGRFHLYVRGTVQADGRSLLSAPAGNSDQFLLRRVRAIIEGTLLDHIDFRIMPDFAGASTRLFDAYADLRHFRAASLVAGKFKSPVSLERLQSASALYLVERAYPTQLAANRDIGLMLHGEFDAPGAAPLPRSFPLYMNPDWFSYQLGVFNGARNNGNIDGDTNDDKEVAGRLFWHPFQAAGPESLRGLGLGIAGSWGQPDDERLASYLSPAQLPIVSYANQAGTPTATVGAVRADGAHARLYPQLYWNAGPWGLLAEYAWSSQQLAVQTLGPAGLVNQRELTAEDTAWNLTLVWVATGEDNVFLNQGIRVRHPLAGFEGGIRPARDLDPAEGGWGAVQLVARVTGLDVEDGLYRNFGTATQPVYAFADPRSSVDGALSFALGANWWLSANAKLMLNYEETHFEGGAVATGIPVAAAALRDREVERVVLTRFQAAF